MNKPGPVLTLPLSGQRSVFMTKPVMIAAIIAFAVITILVSGLGEIVSGLLDLAVGLILIITGAALFCLSFSVEYSWKAIRFIWRCI